MTDDDRAEALRALAEALLDGDEVRAVDADGALAVLHVRAAAGHDAQRLAVLPIGFDDRELEGLAAQAKLLRLIDRALRVPPAEPRSAPAPSA